MAIEMGSRLFPIQAYDYETGICRDGRQVVMGLLCPEVVAFFFDTNGNLIGNEAQKWTAAAAEIAGDKPPYNIFGGKFDELISEQIQARQAELGFRLATIQVREFFDSRYPVGIQVLPDHLVDVETATWFPNEEERRHFIKSRDEWLAAGSFVWWWGRDYFMSRDGEVEST